MHGFLPPFLSKLEGYIIIGMIFLIKWEFDHRCSYSYP